jgi:hypothetical protein
MKASDMNLTDADLERSLRNSFIKEPFFKC